MFICLDLDLVGGHKGVDTSCHRDDILLSVKGLALLLLVIGKLLHVLVDP